MNLDPETRKGFFISPEIKKVWQVELTLLKKLLEVCNKYNLRVFAEGGTLLGAVREQGFIPWDDDIDMAMLREDYDKLQKVSKEEFTSPYFFQSGFTDNYSEGISKIRMDGTTAILPYMVERNCHQGIFIDIFPLDSIPEDSQVLQSFIQTRNEKKKILDLYCKNHFSLSNWTNNIETILARIKIRRKGYIFYFKEYDDYIKKYSKTKEKSVSLVSWRHDTKYMRKKEWYKEQVFIPFEDIMIPVPKDYDLILAKQYGDYMKPVKEPTMHGGFEVLDPSCSYKVYLPKIRRKYIFKTWVYRWKDFVMLIKSLISKFKN